MKYSDLNSEHDTPATLIGCLWALGMSGMIVVSVLVMWLGVLRGEMFLDRRSRISAEKELGTVRTEYNTAIQAVNERLAKAEAGRAAAENQAQLALEAKDRAEEQRDQDERELTAMRAARIAPLNVDAPASVSAPAVAQMPAAIAEAPAGPAPSSMEITNFIKGHLARMMGPVVSGLGNGDYAEEVDFHGNPHASLQAIEAERESWAKSWPRRIIQISGAMPKVVFNKDAAYGWQATIAFDWQWIFWGRTGTMVRGVYRDTWKVVPEAGVFKIIFEHSVDSATGRSRD